MRCVPLNVGLLLLCSCSILWFISKDEPHRHGITRDIKEVEVEIIQQTAQATIQTGYNNPTQKVVIDFSSNTIVDPNTKIKLAVGQYPDSSKPYTISIETTKNYSPSSLPSRAGKPRKHFSSDEDYQVFPKSAICDPSQKEIQRRLSRKGQGFNFSPSKLDSQDLPTCNWNQYQGVNTGTFDSSNLKFETVANVFKYPGINFYSTDEITHQSSYPPPKLAKDIISNLTSREEICKGLDSSKWLFCCKKHWSKIETEESITFDFLPIGAQQPCAERVFVAGFPCAMIDWHSVHPDVPGTIFYPPKQGEDKGTQFLLQPWAKPVGQKNSKIKYFDRVATVLEVYSDRPGHFTPEVLPWIVYLVKTLPKEVPILMIRNKLTEKFLQILVDAKLTSSERFVQLERDTVYAAREVIKVQYWPNCASDANFLPSQEMNGLVRQVYAPEIPYQQRNGIVIVHRGDSATRVVSNNDELVARIRRDFPRIPVTVFVSKDYSLPQAIELFRKSKVVIGAHGAGMEINLSWCGQGTHVIEIGYNATHPPLPSGDGSLFGKNLTPDIDEILYILHQFVDK